MNESADTCAFCERERPLTFHHLIPKKVHKKPMLQKKYSKEEMLTLGILLCSDCHSTIHRHIDHIELARLYHTKEALLGHPEISKFVKWVSKQDKRVK